MHYLAVTLYGQTISVEILQEWYVPEAAEIVVFSSRTAEFEWIRNAWYFKGKDTDLLENEIDSEIEFSL